MGWWDACTVARGCTFPGVGVYLSGRCTCWGVPAQVVPPWTDRHLWKHNLRKLCLRAVITRKSVKRHPGWRSTILVHTIMMICLSRVHTERQRWRFWTGPKPIWNLTLLLTLIMMLDESDAIETKVFLTNANASVNRPFLVYGYCRGITRIHRLPSRPSHPYGRQPHSLIFMSTLYKATSCLPAKS